MPKVHCELIHAGSEVFKNCTDSGIHPGATGATEASGSAYTVTESVSRAVQLPCATLTVTSCGPEAVKWIPDGFCAVPDEGTACVMLQLKVAPGKKPLPGLNAKLFPSKHCGATGAIAGTGYGIRVTCAESEATQPW